MAYYWSYFWYRQTLITKKIIKKKVDFTRKFKKNVTLKPSDIKKIVRESINRFKKIDI